MAKTDARKDVGTVGQPSAPLSGAETQAWEVAQRTSTVRRRNRTLIIIAATLGVVVIAVIAVVAVLMLGGKEDNVSAPASPAIVPSASRDDGVASPAVAAAPAIAPVAPIAAAPSSATPATAASASTTTPYGVPHYTDPQKLQEDTDKFLDGKTGRPLSGVPSIVTVQGRLWSARTRNNDRSISQYWYLVPMPAVNEPTTPWVNTQVVRLLFPDELHGPLNLLGQVITVRGTISNLVTIMNDPDHVGKVRPFISLGQLEIITHVK